jgi:hypothetical protein
MIDQLPKQGGGQLPPFRGALTPATRRARATGVLLKRHQVPTDAKLHSMAKVKTE